MRYILMHQASANDEAGVKPTPEPMQEVGAMVGLGDLELDIRPLLETA